MRVAAPMSAAADTHPLVRPPHSEAIADGEQPSLHGPRTTGRPELAADLSCAGLPAVTLAASLAIAMRSEQEPAAPTARLRSQVGLTLIETLIAMVLLALIGLGVSELVASSASTVAETSADAARNTKLTSAMTTIQRHLSEAFSPIVNAGYATSHSTEWGNEIIFLREEHPEGESVEGEESLIHVAERIAWVSKLANGEPLPGGGGVIAQVRTSAKGEGWPCEAAKCASLTEWSEEDPAVTTRVLVANMPEPTATDPLFRYYVSATQPMAANDASQLNEIGMVNVRLASHGVFHGPASATNALVSTVYLTGASRGTGEPGPSCPGGEGESTPNSFTASYLNPTFPEPHGYTEEEKVGEAETEGYTQAPLAADPYQIDSSPLAERHECLGSGEACSFHFELPDQPDGKPPTNGIHTLKVWLEDQAGNVGIPAIAEVNYRNTECTGA